ncbi:MAG: winged helix DNA-binding protein [Candidatus Aenigmarchaeota archaeon]|nr:winged helix DNA-binding protein [Candidatus Aenigmarchaeota archaeon]
MLKQKLGPKMFFRIKPVKMLTALKVGPKYATIIAKETDCTYSHTVKILDMFEEYGLVDFEKKGRIKIVKLTEFGDDVAKGMDAILTKLSRVKEKI